MKIPTSTDVLIVGAGPTGLALSIALQQSGVDHVLIDALVEGQHTSRAAVIHAHTLEVLDSIGVAGALADAGLRLSRFSIRDRDTPLVRLRFDRLDTRFPFLLMLPQDATERILSSRYTHLGGTIHRGARATNLADHGDRVEVNVTSADASDIVSARYVVGADGMHSVVRASLGIEFDGAPYEESFVLADVRMDWPLGADEVMLFFSPSGLVVVAPLPGGAYRIVATLDNAPATLDLADVQSLLDARGPASSRATVIEVLWSSRFRVHHRLAAAYRRGRALIMGDAAHVHSPAGGQGMNTGLVDACVLGRVLADVVHGRRPDEALDEYEHLRRPAAAEVLKLAGRLTGMATMKSSPKRRFRNARLTVLDHLPFAKHRLTMRLSGLSRRELAGFPG